MRKDIMVDIETLGTGENATVFQISAMSFDLTTGDNHDSINLIGDIEKYSNLNVEGSTLKWWLNTDKELLTELLNNGTYNEYDLFEALHKWLVTQSTTGDMKDVYLWGNGILFDNAKLQTNLNSCSVLKYPIYYKNDRDVRTILELASMKSGLTEDEIKESVTDENEHKHDALDDITYQIRLVVKCYRMLMKSEVTQIGE
ncbi:3'-5' exonuclease [Lysinibacillus fusiformis]|uniref:3'-5' exonuclease n=1 Tax=Lysinibacillus fusiformis TaxID=28031 RepID=UPI00263A8E96|nr:3'-5' exonuclease [Lysinibacillus fusiformis]MDC6267258.1 3'-5' exoribonuclease [Lysinibacillus sphaericus]MDN4968308.1 3'-5' exonuclease [Lysinibacillus fusiformis]MDN4968482.1 3'-5' exonuclease [Lysinibacillus fusiformis]